jgi:hypothetical protein
VTEDQTIRLRRKRTARLMEDPLGVTVYPEPHTTPVLPPGWPRLDAADETAVLQACDAFADACRLRLGSVWDRAGEYRVYCLKVEAWRGVCAATLFATELSAGDNPEHAGRNTRLLSIAHSFEGAARIALDFVNWDLEAEGSSWRLALTPVE